MISLEAKWDAIYQRPTQEPQAAEVLRENRFLLPVSGRALDLACGLGGNAILMAAAGLNVDAWDISGQALNKLRKQADADNLSINVKQCIITPALLPRESYDVIVISRFLDRNLCNAIMGALKAGGLLFYQTFTSNKLDRQGPNNPDFLLADNELLRLFSPLCLIYYQEFSHIGDLQFGNRNEACFIGQKPLPEPLP